MFIKILLLVSFISTLSTARSESYIEPLISASFHKPSQNEKPLSEQPVLQKTICSSVMQEQLRAIAEHLGVNSLLIADTPDYCAVLIVNMYKRIQK